VDVYYRRHVEQIVQCHRLTIVTGGDGVEAIQDLKGIADIQTIPMTRRIAPLLDLGNVWRLRGLLVNGNITLLQSVSPKGGLIGMLAGALAGTPVRVHTFTGQVWAARRGMSRWVLRLLDKITATLATSILVDSASQLQFLLDEGVVSPAKARVIGAGSIAGVDAGRFSPDPDIRAQFRARLGYADDAVVILYLGRVARDKGTSELAEAFSKLHDKFPAARLLIVGPDENGTTAEMRTQLGAAAEFAQFVPFTREPENHMRAADIFCIPSYREGFGSVIIEAGACCLPTVASRIYGITDAVVENETGLLVPARDATSLSERLLELCASPARRQSMGAAARQRACELFDATDVSRQLIAHYNSLIITAGQDGVQRNGRTEDQAHF
jgi:glycosyltransferase involved in cell wall biosynthesis